MKKLLTIIISCCFLSGAFAQGIDRQVISSGGGNGASGSNLLSWTIGETVVATGTTADHNPFFQGFQTPTGSVANFQEITLTLSPRWNYISSYIDTNAPIDQIFEDSDLPWSDAAGISVVRMVADPTDMDDKVAVPGILPSFNWDSYHGYQVYVNATNPVTLKFFGQNLTNTTKVFSRGWNMIPMIVKDQNITTEDFFENAAVDGNAFLIRSINGQASYYIDGVTGGNFTMKVGNAYDVYFIDDAAAPVDFSTINAAKSAPAEFSYPETPWNTPVANINPHTVIAPANAIYSLEYGDVIGAFTADGYCAGMGAFNGQELAFVINGANNQFGIQGFNEMDDMNFKVYRPSTDEVFGLVIEFDNNYDQNKFISNGISIIKSIKDVTGIDDNLITDVQIYPNPAVSSLNLTVSGSFSQNAMAYLFGAEDGRLYGEYSLTSNTQINVSNLNSGVYFIKVIDANQVIVKKFVKQ